MSPIRSLQVIHILLGTHPTNQEPPLCSGEPGYDKNVRHAWLEADKALRDVKDLPVEEIRYTAPSGSAEEAWAAWDQATEPIIGYCTVPIHFDESDKDAGLTCGAPVRNSPGGEVCDAGHGGAPYTPLEPR